MHKNFLFSCFLLASIFTACTSTRSSDSVNRFNTGNCDTTTFSYDEDDTSKIVFVSGAVFDTTACAISGNIVDELTSEPITGAWINLGDSIVRRTAKTDRVGYFTIFNEVVCQAENWELSVYHEKYHCMKILYTQRHGGVHLKIKLRKK